MGRLQTKIQNTQTSHHYETHFYFQIQTLNPLETLQKYQISKFPTGFDPTLNLSQNHKHTYFFRRRLYHFLSTKYTILYGMHKSALTLGQIHLPLTNGLSVKCVNKKTFCFFIRIQWDLVKFYYT